MGIRDWLVAVRKPEASSDVEVPVGLRRLIARGGSRFKLPAMGLHSELIDEPSELVCSPLAYPVPAEVREQLLEGSLLLIRMVDLALLEAHVLIRGQSARLEITDPEGMFPIVATLGTAKIPLSFRHLSSILFSPVSIRAMRQSLLSNLRRWRPVEEVFQADTAQIPRHLLATGDHVSYATVFKGQSGEPVVLTRASDLGLADSTGVYILHRP